MPRGKLSDETLGLIEKFCEPAVGILKRIDEHRLDQSNGAIIVTCADGD